MKSQLASITNQLNLVKETLMDASSKWQRALNCAIGMVSSDI